MKIPGRVGGVALEYHHKNSKHPLMSDPQVYLCPHIAAATEVSYNCMSRLVSANVVRLLRGETLSDIVDQCTIPYADKNI